MIDVVSVQTDAPVAFDNMMVELVAKGVHIAPLASSNWAEVLLELEVRPQPNKKGRRPLSPHPCIAVNVRPYNDSH